jgi:hypothetical protein
VYADRDLAADEGDHALEGTSIIAVISVITSTIVALTGVVVPQVIAARKAAVDRAVAHYTWWRDKRVELYSDLLTFCAQTLYSGGAPDEDKVVVLEGRVGTAGSARVGTMFSAFIDAARLQDSTSMKAAVDQLREHVRNEVWQLSKGSGNY